MFVERGDDPSVDAILLSFHSDLTDFLKCKSYQELAMVQATNNPMSISNLPLLRVCSSIKIGPTLSINGVKGLSQSALKTSSSVFRIETENSDKQKHLCQIQCFCLSVLYQFNSYE